MIQCSGYTDDGFIFFVVSVNVKGENGQMTVRMKPDIAKRFIQDLQTAVENVPQPELRVVQ
jgi:hypothetical protein